MPYKCPFSGKWVSIHSLTQRETDRFYFFHNSKPCFNPLPHAEGDEEVETMHERLKVSIHSLTQRETITKAMPVKMYLSFNPLPHAEGDLFHQEVS